MPRRWIRGGVAVLLSVVLSQSATWSQQSTSSDVVIRDIEFTGNTFVGAPRLTTKIHSARRWLHSYSTGKYDPRVAQSDVNDLIQFYRSFGYMDAKVSLETQRDADGSEVTLVFHIQEGPRYRIVKASEVVGPASLPRERLQTILQTKKGDNLTHAAIAADAHRIENYCESLHRPVHVEPIPVWSPEKPGLAWVRYQVTEKTPPAARGEEASETPPAKIGHIRIAGNKNISRKSILSHLYLRRGQTLDYAELRRNEAILADMGVFVVDPETGVGPTITVIDSESDGSIKDILISVKEKP